MQVAEQTSSWIKIVSKNKHEKYANSKLLKHVLDKQCIWISTCTKEQTNIFPVAVEFCAWSEKKSVTRTSSAGLLFFQLLIKLNFKKEVQSLPTKINTKFSYTFIDNASFKTFTISNKEASGQHQVILIKVLDTG